MSAGPCLHMGASARGWQFHEWLIGFSVASFKATTDLAAEHVFKVAATGTPLPHALGRCDLAMPPSRDGISLISLKFGLHLVTPNKQEVTEMILHDF